MIRPSLIIFLLVVAHHASLSQNSPVLDAYIDAGLRSNLALQQKQLDWQQSLEAVRQARGLYYPALQLNATFTKASGGRRIDLPVGDLLNPVYATLNQLTSSNSFPEIANESIQFLPDNYQETYLKFAYPLFNSDIKYNKEIKTRIAAGREAGKAAYASTLKYEITVAYLRLLQAREADKILQQSKTVLLELRRFNESLVRNNAATRDAVSTADFEISKIDRQIAELEAQKQTAQAWFNFLLNRNPGETVSLDTILLAYAVPAYAADSLIQAAMHQRKEIAALQAGSEAASSALKMQEKGRILPDAYIGGQFGFQGYGYNFGEDQAYFLAQIGLSYDLFTGGQQKSKIQQAKLEASKIDVQSAEASRQIALQVTQAWHQLEAARSGLLSARAGERAAEESFRIVNNKYRANQVLLLEWLDARNRFDSARQQVVLSRIELLLREAELFRAAGI